VTSSPTERQQTGQLQNALIDVAGTPDDSSRIGADLVLIARLVADQVSAVEYASVTSRHEGAYATVAASSDLAAAVDQAQYGEGVGPCLQALDSGRPTAVPDIAATMRWPGFRASAAKFGLHTSLSLPLFAGSGKTIAALNLYSRRDTMEPLTAAVWAAYDPEAPGLANHDDLDPGGRELTAGIIGALALRSMIQQSIGVLMATTGRTADRAYLDLRMRAAESGASLTDTAVKVIEEWQT
jgi:GAF domain